VIKDTQLASHDLPGNTRTATDWNAYWRGTGEAGAYASGGVSHPAVRAFWEQFFKMAGNGFPRPSLLDLATGNGAVVECALSILGAGRLEVSCVDISESAIANIRQRFPDVSAIVADLRDVPLESGSYNLVTSQFGLEYAGEGAVGEAARLTAVGGLLAVLMHNSSGSIHRECEAALDAIERLQGSGFIPLAQDLFRTAFAAMQGEEREPYEAAATRFDPAVKALEQVMTEHGEQVAGNLVARLYSDVRTIHANATQYDPKEVSAWLGRMEEELESYAGRMASMKDSALDEAAFAAVRDTVSESGFVIGTSGPFFAPEERSPLGWALVATRES
jgi:ubiquinone/menaquinone biosynthesis C-methylase UbiE